MKSIFGHEGLTWVENKNGKRFHDNTVVHITEKPVLSFAYDNLYCEPTLIRKVINNVDCDLTQEEIAEVLTYIKNNPVCISGIDCHGAFHEHLPIDQIINVENCYPPGPKNLWRLDLNTHEWYRIWPIDNMGTYNPSLEDSNFTTTPTPHEDHAEWLWDGYKNMWVDLILRREQE